MLALLAIALALGGQSPPAARLLTGTVLDPGNLPVAAADVSLRCGAATTSTSTDGRGLFRLRIPEQEGGCRLLVQARGFAPAERSLDDRDAHALIVRLGLRTHEEQLTVRGDIAPIASPHSATADGELVREFVTSGNDMVEYARALAGGTLDRAQVVVDGSRRTTLPPASRIARIIVNRDPFSAALSGLDGARVEVETAPLRRTWSYTATVSPGTIVGSHPLGAGHQSRARRVDAAVSGPLPAAGLAWSAGGSHTRREQEVPLLVSQPGASDLAGTVSTGDRATTAFGALSYASKRTRIGVDVSIDDAQLAATDAGGLVWPEAATDGSARTVEAHANGRTSLGATTLRSSGTLAVITREAVARSVERGTTMNGGVTGGGAALSFDKSRAVWSWWSVRADGRARGRSWSAGLEFSGSHARERFVPNAEGALLLAPAAEGGVRSIGMVLDRGVGEVDVRTGRAAAYGEVNVWQTTAASLNSGLRVDAERGDTPVLQPRVSGTVRLAGTQLVFGAGRFAEEWTAGTLLPLWARAAPGIEHLALDGACWAERSCEWLRGTTRVEIARQRQSVASIGLSRAIRRIELSGEYRWSATNHVPSLSRVTADEGWTESFGSGGRQRQDEIRTRVGYGTGGRSLVAHYTWRHARETADGWYGSPITASDLSLWVPAAYVPAHDGGFVFSLRTQGGTSLSAVGSVASGRPVDVVLSPQSLAEALTGPRRPGFRNSGIGPNYASVSLYVSQRIDLPLTRARGRVGAQVINLLGRRNLLAPVTVVDSPIYGRATGAAPGRALALWVALERRH